MSAASIPAMVWQRAGRDADRVILRRKARGIWQAVSWRDLAAYTRAMGQALLAAGFRPGDVGCILAENRPEWVYADLAILGAGGVSAGIYPSLNGDGVAHVLRDSGCRLVFVENEQQLDKVLDARDQCPGLERIVIFDMKGLRDLADPMCESIAQFLARGARYAGRWEDGIAAIGRDQLALLLYTAGSTGAPKGVMLSHRNILAQVEGAAALLRQDERDNRLAFLPMSHAAERILGLYLALHTGTVSNFVESADTLFDNLRELQPTVMSAVPRIWERLYARIATGVAAATPTQRLLFRRAIDAGLRLADARQEGGPPPWLRARAWLWRQLVLRNARRALGLDRLRLGMVAASEISPALIRWFMALGIDLVELYGQSECAGLAAAPVGQIRFGSVGKPVPYCELRLAPDGEILLRGDIVCVGYWKRPEATAEALRDGWLHTGDLGRIKDGWLHIAGRKQDALVTARGAAIMPADIEMELKLGVFIADALVLGDREDFLSCLVMADTDAVEAWARENRISYTSIGGLLQTEPVRNLIAAEIDAANARLGKNRALRGFRLIAQRLEPEDPELTPVLKLKRRFVMEKYRHLIEEIYCGSREPTDTAVEGA
jgi:long-chain acyl-CoA synthetase